MRIYRNGVIAYDDTPGLLFDDGQLSQISLGMVAMDAEIGQGTLAVPGNPGWNAGDRITIYEGGTVGNNSVTFGGVQVTFGGVDVVWTNFGGWGQFLIYTGFVGQHSRIRNPRAPLEFTSIYNLMDVNRQLIGRKVVDYAPTDTIFAGQAAITASGLMQLFIDDYLSDLDLDLTYLDTTDTTPMQPQTFNSDGIMDMVAEEVLYTAKTVYLAPTQTENRYEFHFHGLTTGPTATISIDDTPFAADGVTVFAPRDPEVRYDPLDIKNRIEMRNGVNTVAGQEVDSINTYDVGGLKWEAVINQQVSEDSLVLYTNNLLLEAFERITYLCTIGPLDGAQVIGIPVGSIVNCTSVVWQIGDSNQRLSRVTLTPAGGEVVAPGLWDAHLELSTPTRLPAAALGTGGQGGYSGLLTDPYLNADHFKPVSGGQFIASDIPVGAPPYRIAYQLCDKAGNALIIPSIPAFFTLEQWSDLAETLVGDGWSISIPTGGDVTDNFGLVYVDLSHDTAGTSVVINVIASL